MAHAINDLLVSDMTLLWPSSGSPHHQQHLSVEDLRPYTWEGELALKTNAAQRGLFGGSFRNLVTSLEHSAQKDAFQNDCVCAVPRGANVDTCGKGCAQTRYRQLSQSQERTESTNNCYDYCEPLSKPTLENVVAGLVEAQVSHENDQLLCPGERKVKGTFVHHNVLTGFRYIVRPADSNKPLFDGKALQLVSIGRGYGKRITFESNSLCVNDNYFYSDTNEAGYGFRLVTLEEGQQFTVKDVTDTPVGFATVTHVEEQEEISQKISPGTKELEKRVHVILRCSLELFSGGHNSSAECSVDGVAVLHRKRPGTPAVLEKLEGCRLDWDMAEYCLVPGTDLLDRFTLVSGADVADIPSTYIVKGLLPRELPVVGTFVHPNIIIGAKYKIRSLGTNKYLFDGAALKLLSIGKGYGKRITFQSDSFLTNDNYFYSDTSEEGYGFTIEALSVGDSFRVVDASCSEVARGEVYRTDAYQQQRGQEGDCLHAYVDIRITCNFAGAPGVDNCTITLNGVAHLEKTHRGVIVTGVTDVSLGGALSHLNDSGLSLQML